MISFTAYDIERNKMIESFLSEMPYLNKIPRNGTWSKDQIQGLWELIEDEPYKEIGFIGNEKVVMLEQSGTRYCFLLNDETPVFVATFLRRININAWQEDIIAKDTSGVDVEGFYKFLNKKLKMAICSSQSHSQGMRKVWLRLLQKQEYKTYEQSTRNEEEFTQIDSKDPKRDYESKAVFRINKIK